MLFSQNKVEDAKDNREGAETDHLYPTTCSMKTCCASPGCSPASKKKGIVSTFGCDLMIFWYCRSLTDLMTPWSSSASDLNKSEQNLSRLAGRPSSGRPGGTQLASDLFFHSFISLLIIVLFLLRSLKFQSSSFFITCSLNWWHHNVLQSRGSHRPAVRSLGAAASIQWQWWSYRL